MPNEFTPRLRGNTFFLLLLRAVRQDFGVAPSWGNSSQGLTQTQLFATLMKTVKPNYQISNEETLRQYLSQYLRGDKSRSTSRTYYPFKESGFQASADSHVKNHYPEAINRMDELCRTYLDYQDNGVLKLLVGGLVSLIMKDDSIPESAVFNTGYKEVQRSNLADERDFILQPFLLSVWHYILTNQPDAVEGGETYLNWTEDAGGGNPRRIITRCGQKRAQNLNEVSLNLPAELIATAKDTTQVEEESEESESKEEYAGSKQELDTEPVDDVNATEIYEQDYQAPFYDPISKQEIRAQFHVENHGTGVAAGIVYGGITIGGKK